MKPAPAATTDDYPLEPHDPYEQGPLVEDAQRRLNRGNNPFGDFYNGKVHGIYDNATQRGAWQAKWALGYDKESVNRSYGESLDKLLSGAARLSDDQTERRDERLDKAERIGTLELTTPLTKGDEVKWAQHALSFNAFRRFYEGPKDGTYDEETAAATREAKWTLGYEEGNMGSAFGPSLYRLLLLNPLDAEQVTRSKERAGEEPPWEGDSVADMRAKMLDIAIGKIGVKENPPNSNHCPPFTTWYGFDGAWCAMFVSWCGHEAGLTAFRAGSYWAYCPYMVSDAKAGRNGLTKVASSAVEAGDIVLYDWGGDGVSDHVGIFERWTGSSTFNAIEGNTSYSSDSNGGEVMRRSRSTADVILFARVTR